MTLPLDHYRTEYARARAGRPRGEGEALARTRDEALGRFLDRGFPTTRQEEWRFTSVAPIAEQAFALARPPAGAGPADVDRLRFHVVCAAELVFVDGHYVPALSTRGALRGSARAGSLAAAVSGHAPNIDPHLARVARDGSAFVALNTAFFADGAYIDVPCGTALEHPIHVLFVSTGQGGDTPVVSHPRVLAVLGDNSQASIVETYAGPDSARYFTNVVTEIVLGEHAVLDHYKVQRESTAAYHVGSIHLRAARSATCSSHSVSLGGAIVRNDVVAVLGGEGGECTLNGLYLADGQRLVDNHTTIDHAMPHCGSREMYRGILADRARGVFNGKIIVRPDAQKTDAKQTNRALLLSEDAQINTKPELEIFANDVKCTHGAAVGQLDEDAVFYLRSRGFGLTDARRMLIHAFLGDVLHRMPLAVIRTSVEHVLERQLARALGAAA
ncbi:MAG: Fe-S cluster assembly protein SufD [Acidobacteria bacterium RIFCSPLOWO2_02_FULL_68_18]|nr:MAG: Fe-S cluster assembly protein SufD [Acidobacteria bacterium RIFCSPLOWO2_02_FULL_68_18]OFW50462.1 MAG: Fe-S cluster assembly protein SufD [Acidobacteria bacterium RIFCSPLOWO2_12_FULL_68_19]